MWSFDGSRVAVQATRLPPRRLRAVAWRTDAARIFPPRIPRGGRVPKWADQMTVIADYPHIDAPPGEAPRLRRTPRVRVAQVAMDYLAHGWSPEEMCRQHPYLSLAEAHAAMAYYYDHQPQIDEEIRTELARIDVDRGNATPAPAAVRLAARSRRA
jgi:uncharacterized protein (DUF433 family)